MLNLLALGKTAQTQVANRIMENYAEFEKNIQDVVYRISVCWISGHFSLSVSGSDSDRILKL